VGVVRTADHIRGQWEQKAGPFLIVTSFVPGYGANTSKLAASKVHGEGMDTAHDTRARRRVLVSYYLEQGTTMKVRVTGRRV
jgi:hypothetical protein